MDDRMIPLSVLREYMPKLKDEDLKELGPVEYDQSKVPEVSKKHAENVRRKAYLPDMTESFARGVEYAGLIASESVGISNENKERQDNVETQFNSVQQELTDKDPISAPEIIAARNGEVTLSERLDKEHQNVNAQLAQTNLLVSNFPRLSLETEDGARVQRAINYAKENNITRILVTESLLINTVITIDNFDNLTIFGNGVFNYGEGLDKGSNYYPIFKVIGSKNLNINVRFVGDGNTFINNNRCAILLEGSDTQPMIENIHIEDCTFENFSSFVVRINSASYLETTVSKINVKNVFVRRNTFKDVHTAILAINGGVRTMKISENTFTKLSGNAIKIDNQMLPTNGEIPGDIDIYENVFSDFNPIYRTGSQNLQSVITCEEQNEHIRIFKNTFKKIINSENGILLLQQGDTKTGLKNILFEDNTIDTVTSISGMLIHIKVAEDGEVLRDIKVKDNHVYYCTGMEFLVVNGAGKSVFNLEISGNIGDGIKRLVNNLSVQISGVTVKNNKFGKCTDLFIRINESSNIEIQGNKVGDCIRFIELKNAINVAKSIEILNNEFSQITAHNGTAQAVLLNLGGSNLTDNYLISNLFINRSSVTDAQIGLEVNHGLAKCVVENVIIGSGYSYGIVFRSAGAFLKFSSVKGQTLAGLYTADNVVYGLENNFEAIGTYGAVRGANYKEQVFSSWSI